MIVFQCCWLLRIISGLSGAPQMLSPTIRTDIACGNAARTIEQIMLECQSIHAAINVGAVGLTKVLDFADIRETNEMGCGNW